MEQVNVETQGGKTATELQALVGPLTLRDAIVIAGAILILVGSMIPIPWTKTANVNMWIFPGLPFQLLVSLLLPLGVGAGFAWRRLTGRSRVRVGSLSLDQFGSIAALISGAFFFNSYAATMSPAYLLGLLGSVAMIFGTTLARYFGFMRRDFLPGDPSVITEDVYPVAGSAATSSTATASVGDANEVFGARQTDDGPRPIPQTPRTETALGTPVAPGSKEAVVAVGTIDEIADVVDPASQKSAADSNLEAHKQAENLEKFASDEEEKKAETESTAAEISPSPETVADIEENNDSKANNTEDAAVSTTDNAALSNTSGVGTSVVEPEVDKTEASVKSPEKSSDKSPTADRSVDTSALSPTPAATDQEEVPGLVAAAAVLSETNSNTETAKATESTNEPKIQGSASTKPVSNDSAKSEFPEATLGQDNVEKPENSIAGTGLSPVVSEPVADEKKPAPNVASQTPAPTDATAAIPAARLTPNATAALSRTEIDAQMAAAASQSETTESTFGARADLVAEDAASKSFWFALNQSREVFDPRNGSKLTTLQPGVWILCLEDRGGDYLISLDGGRQAVLRDLDNLQFPEN